KPDPEPYLLAAQRLGVDVTRCVAIEDSPAGIASARAAGAATLGVEAVVPVLPAPGLSRTPSLELVDVALLSRLVAGDVVDLMEDDAA
ncbi:HAD-IA family hydrolase, partial [Cellulosimicrobium funkei]